MPSQQDSAIAMYMRIFLAALAMLAMAFTSPAMAYMDAGEPETVKLFNSVEFRQKVQAQYGNCALSQCDGTVKLTCFNQGKPQTHFLDMALNPVADGNSGKEPAAWTQCMAIKKFSGDPADMFTAAKIKLRYGNGCAVKERCADMFYVDCNAATDGPAYYLNSALEQIGTGGGFCMGGHCTGAPDIWQSCVNEVTAELKDKMAADGKKK